jgi:hypothetical protein
MSPDLLFCLSSFLVASGVFSASRGTGTELGEARRHRGGHEHLDSSDDATERTVVIRDTRAASVGGL